MSGWTRVGESGRPGWTDAVARTRGPRVFWSVQLGSKNERVVAADVRACRDVAVVGTMVKGKAVHYIRSSPAIKERAYTMMTARTERLADGGSGKGEGAMSVGLRGGLWPVSHPSKWFLDRRAKSNHLHPIPARAAHKRCSSSCTSLLLLLLLLQSMFASNWSPTSMGSWLLHVCMYLFCGTGRN